MLPLWRQAVGCSVPIFSQNWIPLHTNTTVADEYRLSTMDPQKSAALLLCTTDPDVDTLVLHFPSNPGPRDCTTTTVLRSGLCLPLLTYTGEPI